MTCQTLASTCDGLDVRPVRLYMRHTDRPLCAGCRAALDAKGASYTLVERRGDDRPFRAPWLSRLTAREDTWRDAA